MPTSTFKSFIQKYHRFSGQLAYLPQTLTLVWAGAGYYAPLWGSLLVIRGILPAATIYLSRIFIDSLVAALASQGTWEALQPTLLLALLMAGLLVITELLNSILNWVRMAQAELIQDHLRELVHEKSTQVDLAFYETAEYFDRFQRVHTDATGRPLALLESLGALLQNGITLLGMGALLLPYGLWLPVALFLSTLPAFFIVVHYNRRVHHWWEETTADRRWAQYFDTILTHSHAAAEVRLFGLAKHFKVAYQKLRRRLRNERLAMVKQQGLAQLAASGLAILISGLAMLWIVWQALQGLATLGDLALFYQAFNRGQSLMRTFLGNVGQIYNNTLFLGNLFDFLQLNSQVISPENPVPVPCPMEQGITFEAVSFSYPGSDRMALRDFSLAIPANQSVAIVGANGAGKSTLIKLLCRFYDVTTGAITVDGVNLRAFSLEELRRQITILFQFPVAYQSTATQNIAFGDICNSPAAADIKAAAKAAGAHAIIDHLPNGYQTLLGKWFSGGTDLSGGEWQRVALARAFFRQAEIVILDEPTSFMDSWAEAEWLSRFRKLVEGKTTIIITHRFTTAMQADIIHVMDQGHIIESGSHAELMTLGGRYAQSWLAQMRSGEAYKGDVAKVDVMSTPASGVNGHTPQATVNLSPDDQRKHHAFSSS